MDGFRDRLNRGTTERASYDRYDRAARRSTYGAAAAEAQPQVQVQPGLSAAEVSQIVDGLNGKQLDMIAELLEEANKERFESENQILAAIDDVIDIVSQKEAEPAQPAFFDEPEPAEPVVDQTSEEILRAVNSNGDILAQFAEEQLPMLVRGNSSVLNPIRLDLEAKDELLKEILNNSSQLQPQEPVQAVNNNDEVLSAAANNNALLNALRSEVAGVQAEIRRTNERLAASADEDAPLDNEDLFTKAQAEAMYKNLEENIHAECVKVYRNVQKVIEDQNSATGDTVRGSIGGLTGLSILNLVLVFLNLAALLLRIFGII